MIKVKRIILTTSIFILGFFVLTSKNFNVYAQTGTQTERKTLRQEVKEKVQERNVERKASVEAKLKEAQKTRISNFWGRLNIRLQAHIDRLMLLAERIENRLNKFKEENSGADTVTILAEIEEAKELLSETQAMLDDADTQMEEVLNSEDPKSAFMIFRDSVKEIKENLKSVHGTLVKVIGDIKGLRIGNTSKEL